jgi:hypothetical protein
MRNDSSDYHCHLFHEMIVADLTNTSCFRKLPKKTLLFSIAFLEGEFEQFQCYE